MGDHISMKDYNVSSLSAAARPMTEEERIVSNELHIQLSHIDNFAYEGPPINYDRIAVAIVRALAVNLATKALAE